MNFEVKTETGNNTHLIYMRYYCNIETIANRAKRERFMSRVNRSKKRNKNGRKQGNGASSTLMTKMAVNSDSDKSDSEGSVASDLSQQTTNTGTSSPTGSVDSAPSGSPPRENADVRIAIEQSIPPQFVQLTETWPQPQTPPKVATAEYNDKRLSGETTPPKSKAKKPLIEAVGIPKDWRGDTRDVDLETGGVQYISDSGTKYTTKAYIASCCCPAYVRLQLINCARAAGRKVKSGYDAIVGLYQKKYVDLIGGSLSNGMALAGQVHKFSAIIVLNTILLPGIAKDFSSARYFAHFFYVTELHLEISMVSIAALLSITAIIAQVKKLKKINDVVMPLLAEFLEGFVFGSLNTAKAIPKTYNPYAIYFIAVFSGISAGVVRAYVKAHAEMIKPTERVSKILFAAIVASQALLFVGFSSLFSDLYSLYTGNDIIGEDVEKRVILATFAIGAVEGVIRQVATKAAKYIELSNRVERPLKRFLWLNYAFLAIITLSDFRKYKNIKEMASTSVNATVLVLSGLMSIFEYVRDIKYSTSLSYLFKNTKLSLPMYSDRRCCVNSCVRGTITL